MSFPTGNVESSAAILYMQYVHVSIHNIKNMFTCKQDCHFTCYKQLCKQMHVHHNMPSIHSLESAVVIREEVRV